MSRGAWMCRQQHHEGLRIWFAPRENEKPFTDSERAQKWRLSLASLLFFTVLLSDHLWFCAEAKLTRTRDKGRGALAGSSMGPLAPGGHPLPPPSAPSNLTGGQKDIFLRNFTKPLCRLENYYPLSPSPAQCRSVEDADYVCRTLNERQEGQPTRWELSNFYLSFCNSYTLSDLFAGLSNPDTVNCSGDVVQDGDMSGCKQCVQAYQRYDQHAQEKYDEFEVLLQKYLQSEEYSVKSCSEDCKLKGFRGGVEKTFWLSYA